MDIGNKILELRKKNNFSQEQLAEKMKVARQTISKWELGETSPDIKQAKELSKIFNVSLDELVDNDIKDLVIEKVSNTEKLAGLTIKIIKAFIIIFITFSVVFIILGILGMATFNKTESSMSISFDCVRDNKEYTYDIEVKGDSNLDPDEMPINIFDTNDLELKNKIKIEDYNKVQALIDYIKAYNESNNGTCN